MSAGGWRRKRWVMVVVASLLGVGITTGAAQPASADTLLANTFNPTVGPFGPITVVGDSVLLGSALYGPTLSDQLVGRGWGPVRFRAGVGNSTGYFGGKAETHSTYWIDQWRSEGWDPPNVVVNLGANDSVSCDGSSDCAYRAIMHVVDAIGPGHQVWWPKITRHPVYLYQQAGWNAALDRVASERSDFHTWDWPSVMASGPFPSPDWTHLNPTGYRLRSDMMAREITADLTHATRTGTDATLPTPAGDSAPFVPLQPERLLDTRDFGPPIPGGTFVDVDMTSHVPAGTTAVAVNLTSAASDAPGFLTGFPCDRARPEVSNVNHAAGVARGSLAVVPLSATGHLCVLTRATGHVIVDLQGAFVPGAPDGTRLTPLAAPQRLLDTRETGRAAVLEIAAPTGAEAVAVNLTVTNVEQPGWLKAYPCGTEPPDISNVNFLPLDTVAGAAFVPVSATGTICVQTLVPVDVVVDITGVFIEDGELEFVPAQPTRMLDTRSGIGGWSPIQGGGQSIDTRVVPPGAAAVTGTITIVAPLRGGWLKAYPCGVVPDTSSVNAIADAVFANSVTVGVDGAGKVCVAALSATQTLFDVTGWWVA